MNFPDIKLKFLQNIQQFVSKYNVPPSYWLIGIKLHASIFSVVSGPWMKLDQRMFLLLDLMIKGKYSTLHR